MPSTYNIRIKKEYAAAVIEDLEKMKAVEFLKDESSEIPEWQKKEVRKRVKEIKKDPSILVDEKIVFNMLNRD